MLSPAMLWGNGKPKLISIIGKGLLAYTNDLKNWTQVDVSSSLDVTGKGIAYNSTDDVLMISNVGSVGNFPQQVRKTKLATFKIKTLYSNALPASGYNPSAGKLTYNYGKWLYGDINTRVAQSIDNGSTWTNFNTWGSSATRNPSIVRYFDSAARYVSCYPNVSQIGVSPSGSFNTSWSVIGTGFTNQTRFVEEGTTGNFLALGGSSTVGQIATSTNLTSWTVRTWITGTPLPNWAAWNGTKWVVVANGGNIATSTDGITWTKETSPVAGNLLWVDWSTDENQFVAVGDNMIVITSPDGITWTQLSVVGTNFSLTVVPFQIVRIR